MARHVYIIEDDESIRELIKAALKNSGYDISDFETAEEALESIHKDRPDLAIFDIMLPGIDGLKAVEIIRNDKKLKNMPIMLLTAKDGELDKVKGLDKGADDYMTKPFGILELSARVRSLLRRNEPNRENPLIIIKDLEINTDKREIKQNGDIIELSYKEYELLLYLINNKFKVVSREELFENIWKSNFLLETRTLDVHVRSLRQKLGDDGSKYIKTIRGVGYCFIMD